MGCAFAHGPARAQDAVEPPPAGEATSSSEETSPSETSADAPATQPADPLSASDTPPGAPDADELLADLLGEADRPPLVAPAPAPAAMPSAVGGPPPDLAPDIDPRILGVAPGQDPPKLLREGAFIVERAGRMARASDGSASLFVFEADDPDAPEAAMILMPCRLLETMEDLTHRRGEQAVFLVSGRVHAYRGANYLLPTSMTERIDRGNLRP